MKKRDHSIGCNYTLTVGTLRIDISKLPIEAGQVRRYFTPGEIQVQSTGVLQV